MGNYTPPAIQPDQVNTTTDSHKKHPFTVGSILTAVYIICLVVGFTNQSEGLGKLMACAILLLGLCLVIGLIVMAARIYTKMQNAAGKVFISIATIGGVIVLFIISAVGALLASLAGSSLFGGGE